MNGLGRCLVAAVACVTVLGVAAQASASGLSMSDDFTGIGFIGAFQLGQQGADGSVGVSARSGEYGLVGIGLASDVSYRFGQEDIYGRLGADVFVAIFGLKLDLAVKSGLVSGSFDVGPGLALEVLLPSPFPVFFELGGQTFGRGTTEFNAVVSMVFPLDGEGLRW